MARDAADFPLLKYLDELVDNMRRLSPKALRGKDVEAVHHARVTARRLKAAGDMFQSLLSKRCRKPFEKANRYLRKQLGPLRDLDVMLEHLQEVRDIRYQPSKAWLKYRLGERRSRVVEEVKTSRPPSHSLARLGSWWGLRQEIADSRDKIDEVIRTAVHLQLDAFAERANASAKGDPHALRISGKSLRYTLELAKAHRMGLAVSVLKSFKQMQDALGLWHDFVVLSECMLSESVECDLALHDPELQGDILSLAQVTLKKAQRQLKKMNELWDRRGDKLCRDIRKAFPLTAPAAAETPAAEQKALTGDVTASEPAAEVAADATAETATQTDALAADSAPAVADAPAA